jgi:fructose-bisphosphate aldolase, class II
MPLIALSDLMEEAERGGYAVPAFNAYNVESAESIIKTSERLHSPVIVQGYNRLFSSQDAMNLSACVCAMALQTRIPVALHLDHGAGEREIVRAIRYGYTGVMIDGSALNYNRNIELTARVVSLAHYVDVTVEGELGHVGKADEVIDESAFTDPDSALDFVQKTGVDLLAVMVGSAHGAYKIEPKLDIERIALIKERIGIPLVLHGGSGIPDVQIRKAVAAGIRKINVATDLCQAFYRGFRNLTSEDPAFSKPLDMFFGAAKASIEEFVSGRIEVFGSRGRA